MRVRPLWVSVCWLLGCAAGASAQSGLVSVSDEMPRVEISLGAGAMSRGPGRDFSGCPLGPTL